MPAEILNRLGAIIPEIKASVANESIGSSMKTEHLETLKFEMRAMKFIWNLPIISVDYLRADEKLCGLCNGKYDNEFKVCGRGESPCHLPCGHVAGHQCLREHLSPYESGFTKCPFCNVDFPQMFTDPAEPAQPTSDLAREHINDQESPDEELSDQISQLSMDSGAPSDEIRRFLSIGEVLERSRTELELSGMGTDVQDFATQATCLPEIGEGEFPKLRRRSGSPSLASAVMKAADQIAKNFYARVASWTRRTVA